MRSKWVSVVLALLLSVSLMSATPSLASITPIDFSGFTGGGFSPTPDSGQLDSDLWRVAGLSDGDGTFGGTHATGDFARGTNAGTTTTGGIYAFTNVGSPGNTVLGVRPIAADFTPGSFTLKVTNTTGNPITDVYVAYTIWVRNDQDRSNSFNFSYSLNDSSYTAVPSLDFTSPAAKDASPTWISQAKSTTLAGVNLANGSSLYLQWTGDDVGGADNRDAFGLDDVEVRATSATAVTLRTLTATAPVNPLAAAPVVGLALVGGVVVWRRRR